MLNRSTRFRDELLDREVFTTLVEAKVLVADYVWQFNVERQHSAFGYQTPVGFVVVQTQIINCVGQTGL